MSNYWADLSAFANAKQFVPFKLFLIDGRHLSIDSPGQLRVGSDPEVEDIEYVWRQGDDTEEVELLSR